MKRNRAGLVSIVGAGPGDPELIAVAGIHRLACADAVVYDHLVHPELLRHAPVSVRKIYVGKRAGTHVLSQAKINALLARLARRGRRVVRLKGGDPYVFGRGGEEALHLAERGIPFEVIPGVTAAAGAAAYAGIPVTHREHASSVTFVTGHEATDKSDARGVDWEALARLKGTIVFYMGVGNLAPICRRLVEAGRSVRTPACAVAWATWPAQRTVRGTLADLPARVREARLGPPAVVIVGEVAALGPSLAWFERLPLIGRRVLVTASEDQAFNLRGRLRSLGAEAVLATMIRLGPPAGWGPVDRAIRALGSDEDDVLFASAHGADRFLRRLRVLGRDARALGGVRVSVIGARTAEFLERNWNLRPDLVADEATSEGLLRKLRREGVRGRRFLFPRTDRGRDALPAGLRKAGAVVDEVTVYRTLPPSPADARRAREELRSGRLDAVLFASSEAVRNFAAAVGRAAIRKGARWVVWASIGPATSATMRELGIPVTVQAKDPLLGAMTDALVKRLGRSKLKHRSIGSLPDMKPELRRTPRR